jgi:hypothetical protein
VKQGDLISLKPEYKNPRRKPTAYLILDQDRTVPQHSYVVLDRAGSMIKIPLSSIFAYEVISEAG